MVVTHKSEEELVLDLSVQEPPPYVQGSSTSPDVFSPPPTLLRRMAPPIARCNHVAIKRANSNRLAGSYVIDPELEIPAEMLAPLDEGQERKNLLIDVPRSDIDIDLWVVESRLAAQGIVSLPGDKVGPRTNVEIRGCNVTLRLHSTGDRPIALKVTSANSTNIALEIPRSFNGPLTIQSRSGNIKFSPALEPMVATFSDYAEVRKCFIGNFKELGFGQGAWEGSALELHSKTGKISMRFVDEPTPKPQKNSWWWYSSTTE
ncbi:hypothetical protein AURDEDRAFT_112071 [Auricularia subglabra TFB-10046 SS5]|nr:hypothetical protein AURDEDRAFT_112071 [Auricularia subglabra TFB-10046 SS5]